MPRPSTKKHVLRTTREILDLSQVELARRVRLAPVTIKKIENHVIAMSEKAALRISMVTGVDREQLIANSNPTKPEVWIGINKFAPLTKERFESAHHAVSTLCPYCYGSGRITKTSEITHRRRNLDDNRHE